MFLMVAMTGEVTYMPANADSVWPHIRPKPARVKAANRMVVIPERPVSTFLGMKVS